jgi:intraflagellar transport protein 74
LEAQIEEAKLPPAEARKRLLKRVKTDNSAIKTLDKRLIKLRKLIENYKKDIKDMSEDLNNKKGEEAQKKKYDILYKKDKEMTNYIESFEDNRQRELKEIGEYENQILEILQNTSKNLMMMN